MHKKDTYPHRTVNRAINGQNEKKIKRRIDKQAIEKNLYKKKGEKRKGDMWKKEYRKYRIGYLFTQIKIEQFPPLCIYVDK